MTKTIGVVTVGRSDYGIYLPILKRIRNSVDLHLQLFVGGMHLFPEFGLTVKDIESDGFEITERVEAPLSSDSPEDVAKAMGLGTIGFAKAYARQRPDLLLVLGDRFEMHAAVVAAVPLNIPIAHIHGGELTEGAIDDSLRHSITKMSHLHFVSTDVYAKRVNQMGEEQWRIVVSGAPSIDNLQVLNLLTRKQLAEEYGLGEKEDFLLVTYHPVTLEHERTEHQIAELLHALDQTNTAIVFTYPNADTGSRKIIDSITQYAANNRRVHMFVNLGTQRYFSLMKHASAMVGNSSSGILEAPSFKLPVVNIGNRQRGRVRARNVIDVGDARDEIAAGIERALHPQFRAGLADLVNPYGDGHAAETIVDTLRAVEVNDKLLLKHFHEI
ncbi:MAG TPA: UDP-N-acetylglucosamine 2-epimerase [Pyrinomonadaceae bacterium]|nr:UDP-N-acetylglucosamine 2-epimerase [Pyrinomonadaceae bacterium]